MVHRITTVTQERVTVVAGLAANFAGLGGKRRKREQKGEEKERIK